MSVHVLTSSDDVYVAYGGDCSECADCGASEASAGAEYCAGASVGVSADYVSDAGAASGKDCCDPVDYAGYAGA